MTNLSVESDAAGHIVGGRGDEGLFLGGGSLEKERERERERREKVF